MKNTVPNVQRIAAALAMCIAFVVMASVFIPLHSGATPDVPRARPVPLSTDPHEGLALIGMLEHRRFDVRAFATESGPRYSVYDAITGEELAVLFTAERVAEYYPELPLPSADFAAPTMLMHVDPVNARWQ